MSIQKMTVKEIKERFDNQVAFYSKEDQGQPSILDSGIVLDMMMDSLAALDHTPKTITDIGCGAGNFALRTQRVYPEVEITLVDLSRNMLDLAEQKIREKGGKIARVIQGDIRDVVLDPGSQDLVLSGAVLHHLRTPGEWLEVLRMIRKSLRPGGSFWYWDLIEQNHPSLQQVQYKRWGDYLVKTFDKETRDSIFEACDREDTPRSIPFITEKMLEAGFQKWDILHKNSLFTALVAWPSNERSE